MDSKGLNGGRLLLDTLQKLHKVWINSNKRDVIEETKNLEVFLNNNKDVLHNLSFKDLRMATKPQR